MDSAVAGGVLLGALALASPLLLAALGELIGERAGVLNIGLEGMMLSGAWAGAAASFATGSGLVGLSAAMVAAMLLAAIFALLTIRWRADAIVVGTGLNLFALGVTGVAHRAMSERFGPYNSAALPEWFFFVAGALLVPLLWWQLQHTRAGLRLRAVGEYPAAADAAGVNVRALRFQSTLICGALCGAAGAFLSLSHINSFGENMTSGRGFIALAIVIFGRWNPFGALAAALLFGAAESTQIFLQSSLNSTYYPLLLTLPYVLTILVLAGFGGRSRAPQALNVPHEN
ncbi:MAG: ral nucleoside transport system permease protein [Abditibacteriota bacterium]|nr:ral nucleoside transport system permease protein [Abditibacteriota bacterium]